MSRKKCNVSYIKPNEPKFLQELKKKIGYKEGPTIDTKREALSEASDDDEREEKLDEKPTVVVLNSGDLTAKEADTFKKQQQENAPADLSKRIIFSRKTKAAKLESDVKEPVRKTARKKNQKIVLSFDDNDEDDNECE